MYLKLWSSILDFIKALVSWMNAFFLALVFPNKKVWPRQ